ncbi:hypothetical protein ANN_13843 [Periplaneta americana]|uniref:Uncharacterized protein n=1 Tax=Periplaneta americana TaxID=6978 RepID=A0ABQ8SUN6_PERAM|nr:hypothetical protein ANN_13843 [Periplaneta americana]
MNPGSSTESYPAFARIGLRENPGKTLNQVTCPERDSNPGHLVSRPDALTVTPQAIEKLCNSTSHRKCIEMKSEEPSTSSSSSFSCAGNVLKRLDAQCKYSSKEINRAIDVAQLADSLGCSSGAVFGLGLDPLLISLNGYNLSIFEELDISQEINKYTRAMGVINSVMKPSLVHKHTRIRLYNTLARPMLSYGSEAWTLRKADKSRITACEMLFMRRTAGYTEWDLKRNCEILKELKTQPVLDYILQYQSYWKHHLKRMRNSTGCSIQRDGGAQLLITKLCTNIPGLNTKSLRSAYEEKAYVTLIVIRPWDGDVNTGGPLGAIRQE